MARRIIETLSGVGDIYAGDLLLRAAAPYNLALWSDEGQPPEGDAPNSAVTVDGNIAITGIGEAVVLAGAEELKLKLQDGRHLLFAFSSTGGRIVGRGGLRPA